MSFLELLQKSRDQAKADIQKRKVDLDGDGESHPSEYFEGLDEETNNNIPNEEEVKTEIKTDTLKKTSTLGDLIILESRVALASAKVLKHINAAKRLAIKLSKGHITQSELQKCFKMQERFKHKKNTNYKLVGGEPMAHLKQLLEKGLDLNVALNTQYQETKNE